MFLSVEERTGFPTLAERTLLNAPTFGRERECISLPPAFGRKKTAEYPFTEVMFFKADETQPDTLPLAERT